MQNDNVSITSVKEVLHNLKKTFQGEPHSLDEVRATLGEDQKKHIDFVDVLEKHHNYLGESIPTLLDGDASVSEKQLHLGRFIHLFNMHAKAEEDTLYQNLLQASDKDLRLEGIAAQDEHDIAHQVVKELKEMNFEVAWSEEIDAKAKVIASLLQNHIE